MAFMDGGGGKAGLVLSMNESGGRIRGPISLVIRTTTALFGNMQFGAPDRGVDNEIGALQLEPVSISSLITCVSRLRSSRPFLPADGSSLGFEGFRRLLKRSHLHAAARFLTGKASPHRTGRERERANGECFLQTAGAEYGVQVKRFAMGGGLMMMGFAGRDWPLHWLSLPAEISLASQTEPCSLRL